MQSSCKLSSMINSTPKQRRWTSMGRPWDVMVQDDRSGAGARSPRPEAHPHLLCPFFHRSSLFLSNFTSIYFEHSRCLLRDPFVASMPSKCMLMRRDFHLSPQIGTEMEGPRCSLPVHDHITASLTQDCSTERCLVTRDTLCEG